MIILQLTHILWDHKCNFLLQGSQIEYPRLELDLILFRWFHRWWIDSLVLDLGSLPGSLIGSTSMRLLLRVGSFCKGPRDVCNVLDHLPQDLICLARCYIGEGGVVLTSFPIVKHLKQYLLEYSTPHGCQIVGVRIHNWFDKQVLGKWSSIYKTREMFRDNRMTPWVCDWTDYDA